MVTEARSRALISPLELTGHYCPPHPSFSPPPSGWPARVVCLTLGTGCTPCECWETSCRYAAGPLDAVKLVRTEWVQQDLAVVAPWLKDRELMVMGGGG